MRNDRPSTGAIFIKRIDTGNRGSRHPSEPLVCEQCGAVYARERWTVAGSDRATGGRREWRPWAMGICPACQQAEEGIPGGYVYVDGDFLDAHRDELQRLLRNEANRASEDNPLSRIMRIDSSDRERLIVETTTEHLAQRLGVALEKAYGGYARYGFSRHNKLARVWWHRD